MPAAVLVAQTVIRKRREHLRLTGRRVFAAFVTIANESIGEREIEPFNAARVRVERNTVRVAQPAEILCYFPEPMTSRIKLIENIDHAATVVCFVIHVRDEQSLIRTKRHEAHALESLCGDGNLETFRKIQVKRLAVCERDVVRR